MPRKKQDTALVASEKRGPLNWKQSAALQKVFETVPREEIVGALLDSGNPKAVLLAERISDEAFTRTNLAKHCAKVQLQPKDVWNILIDTRKLGARLAISAKLTEIVDAVTDQAIPKPVKCPRCKGTGQKKAKKDEESLECDACWGMGTIVREADKDSQKMALEMGELLNQKVPLIAQQFNSYKSSGHDTGIPDMSDWVRGSDALFEGTSEVAEAEVIESEVE